MSSGSLLLRSHSSIVAMLSSFTDSRSVSPGYNATEQSTISMYQQVFDDCIGRGVLVGIAQAPSVCYGTV